VCDSEARECIYENVVCEWGGPVVKPLGTGLIPHQRTKIPHPTAKKKKKDIVLYKHTDQIHYYT